MMRSLFSAVSGLRNHQTYMDVVGNNIANVNTTGFRASRVAFQDILSQTLRPPAGPFGNRGGVNPMQVGLGVSLSSVDPIQTQGSLQSTGKPTDLALEGDGYFILSDGARQYYSRDGAFDRSIDGSLVNPASGLKVMGWPAVNGAVDTTQALAPLEILLGQGMRASASTALAVAGNLDSATPDPPAAVGERTVQTEGTIRDSLGEAHTVAIQFVKTGPLSWTWQVTSAETGVTVTPATATAITFDANGQIVPPATPPQVTISGFANGASDVTLDLDLSGLTQLAGTSEIQATANGAEGGYLTTFVIDKAGTVTGVYSNGVRETLGQIAIANFANPAGLLKAGGNLLEASGNSGQAQIGTPGTGGRATVAGGFLEMSNVDLAQQFTNMIMAERGFQANSRVITASDEILRDLVSLIR